LESIFADTSFGKPPDFGREQKIKSEDEAGLRSCHAILQAVGRKKQA
jgi:hypothetical protein